MGRVKLYASAAEKMQAYRQRKALELAELRAKADVPPPAPQIVEKVVEKIVTVPAPRPTSKPSAPKVRAASSDDRQKALAGKFTDQYGGEDAAKRFKSNTTRAATAARELKALLDRLPYEQRQVVAGDIEVLDQAAGILASYADALEVAKRKAARAQAERTRQYEIKHAAAVNTAVDTLFGPTPDPDAVKAMASDLVDFVTAITPWAQTTKHVDNALIDIDDYSIKQALRSGNVAPIAKAIGEAMVRVDAKGRRHDDNHEVRWWHGGWDDFIVWRGQK